MEFDVALLFVEVYSADVGMMTTVKGLMTRNGLTTRVQQRDEEVVVAVPLDTVSGGAHSTCC